MKHLITLLLCALLAIPAAAIPAWPGTKTFLQPDGTRLTVRLVGDELSSYYQTTDGIPLVRLADGSFHYARLDGERLVSANCLAHEAAVRSAEELRLTAGHAAIVDRLAALHTNRLAVRNAHRFSRLETRNNASRNARAVQSGKQRGLVILVNFQDVKMTPEHTRQAFDDMFNKEGYHDNGNLGSVHDYFYDQSYGQFDLTFDVVGPVTLSHDLSYYGAPGSWVDIRPADMIVEACKLADDSVDFRKYDWDGDGKVDQVFVLCAGQSQAFNGNPEDCIWPHEATLAEWFKTLTLDGVKINTYACSTELNMDSQTRMDGIGAACHEFSHCMGIPDFYDAENGINFGMGYWSLCCYGCYAGNTYGPSGYTAYERWVSGWLEPTELTGPTVVNSIPSLDKKPVAYVVYNPADRNEYYMLENRQKGGWYDYDACSGLMITHVDYDEKAWKNNKVNTVADHQRYTIMAADGDASYRSDSLDLFPNRYGSNELTNTSVPAATLYNANTDGTYFMNAPITNIAVSADGLASFTFKGGTEGIASATSADAWNAATSVDVYSTAGQKLFTAPYSTWSRSLPAGAYLLRNGSEVRVEMAK